ncbi:hypothetical protein EJB10_02385 [Wolbachia endosymbiont of Brugia malayi]|uniref:hypothetical protein n=1 Tax=Wolbachia endosymbiont of Brugia malayi TaxID=80849 RepID=UPI0002D5182F|nr:hypothetical protein [Wolbachia endosymbiont of Brugia malayi]QCB61646.1 hypothetical protein EJB10_02385 [Wolbachia endosymbiont of Brugia malayi]
MELGAEVADQFLSEMNQTKIKIQDAKEATETARNVSKSFAQNAKDKNTELHDKVVNFTKKAETASENAEDFAREAFLSKQSTKTLKQETKEL